MAAIQRTSKENYQACARCRVTDLCAHPGRNAVAYRLEVHRLRKDGLVHSSKLPVRSFFVLCEGLAKSCRPKMDNSQQITGFYLPGEMIAFEDMFNSSTRQDVVAIEPCTLREFICQCDHESNSATWSAMLDLLRSGAGQRRARLRPFAGRQTASKRLSAWLGNLAERCQQRGLDPRRTAFRMTRADIGNYLGLAKETVCRIFIQFQRDGWIEQRGRRFVIRRPEAFLR